MRKTKIKPCSNLFVEELDSHFQAGHWRPKDIRTSQLLPASTAVLRRAATLPRESSASQLESEAASDGGRKVKSLILPSPTRRAWSGPEEDQEPAESSQTDEKRSKGSLAYYCPRMAPFVPPLVQQCVREVESRGLDTAEGIYRVSGRLQTVKGILEKFRKKKKLPDLAKVEDIHVVCGVMKDFLASLTDALIPVERRTRFVDAINSRREAQQTRSLLDAISDLPSSHRDTLAFVLRHLQRVAAAPRCKMDVLNLARVFSPTLIGYSMDAISLENRDEVTTQQQAVMEALLRLPADALLQFDRISVTNGNSELANTRG